MRSDRRERPPGRLVVVGFALLIALGTVLLWLPVSQTDSAGHVSIFDAFFTAVSAVTVTGLAVVDTGTAWSPFGEVVLVAMIQIGGLGVMTLAGFLGLVLNQRLGVRGGKLAGTEIGFTDLGVLRKLLKRIVVFVLVSEALIAILLTARFWLQPEMGFRSALHVGIFHAVSAFNNAGFSTFDHGLEGYVGDWFVSLLIAAAFVLGGIGFPVVFEVAERWRKPSGWSLHTKVTLSATAALLAGGTVLLALLEWNNPATLGTLPLADRLLASFFQSATARTAGFNTVPIGSLQTSSILVIVLLMVIGASSASTGGGIKTSTVAIVVRAAIGELRGDEATTIFDRRVPRLLERQALSLVIAALGAVGTGAFFLSAFDQGVPLRDLLFEAASAFATAGLSTGVTAELGPASRLVLIILMFLGRVGPITFGAAVMLRPQARRYRFAEEALIVG